MHPDLGRYKTNDLNYEVAISKFRYLPLFWEITAQYLRMCNIYRTFVAIMISKKIIAVIGLVACVVLPLGAQVVESSNEETIPTEKKESLFSWSASALVTSNYIWRGLYVGGPSVQLDATVSYAGFFANMWWNVGATDWTFTGLNPEVDVMIGFSRWGLNINYLHCFYFDTYPDGTPSRFFDFRNHPRGGGGTTGEWRVAYGRPVYTNQRGWTTSVNALCAFRTFGRDGYNDETTGELKRAYSTYIEAGVDQTFGQGWSLAARLGITPAKSLYTGYQGDFAVTLVGLKLSKTWTLNYGTLNAFANVMLQPWQLNADNLIRPIAEAGNQKLNLSVGVGWSI